MQRNPENDAAQSQRPALIQALLIDTQELTMRIQRMLACAAAAALCTLPAANAWATPLTLNFSGTVDQVQFDPFDPLGGVVRAGSRLYTYLNTDSATPDSNPAPDQGSYSISGGTYGLAAVVGNVVFPVMRSVNISVTDGSPGAADIYTVFAFEGVAGGLADYFTMSMTLIDPGGTAITGDGFPLALPNAADFSISSFDITGQYTDINGEFIQYEVQGHLIPEPATWLLLAPALALGWRRHA